MKFYASKTDQLIEQIKSHKIKAILLYGPNRGMVGRIFSEIAEKLKLRINEISAKDIIETNYFSQLLNDRNLFNQKEVCKIVQVSDSFNLNFLKEHFANAWHLPIFIAEELGPSSKLRKFCETEAKVAIIACYNEDNQSIAMICSRFFNNKKDITPEAIEYLSQNLSGDSLIIQNELEKIFYYNIDVALIDLEQVKSVINTNSVVNYDQLCIYFLIGDIDAFTNEVNKVTQLQLNTILLIRILSRYIANLLTATIRIEAGENLSDVMSKLSPPIFYKYVEGFKKLLLKYNSSQVIRVLELLQQGEVTAKLSPSEYNIFQTFIMVHHN